MRSAWIEKDVAAACLVDDPLPWKMVYKVKFYEGAVVQSQASYDTEDAAWDAAGDYIDGVAA